MNAKSLNILDVAEYYKSHSISATAKFFHVANERIQQLLIDNNIPIRSKAENNLLRQQAYANTCLELYGVENPAKLDTSREKMRETAKKQAKPVDEAAVIKYYLEPHGLATTATVFHISAARAKQILTEACVLRLTDVAITVARTKAIRSNTDDKYRNLIPSIIKFYETHTLNATKLEFNITRKVLKRLLTANNVTIRSAEDDLIMAHKVSAEKYKETIRQKYVSIDRPRRTVLPEQESTFVFVYTFPALKDRFLKLGGFVDNEYLDKYINLILMNLNTEKQVHQTQAHHIIPRAYYKYNRLKINNLDNNLINLLYKDHILAHYYLALCTVDKLQECNMVAFTMMTNYEYLLTVDELALLNNLDKYQELHEQYSELNAKVKSRDNSGRIHIFKGDEKKMIKLEELAAYEAIGWQQGRGTFKTKAKKIYCVELDRTFPSITAASEQLNIHINNIGICLRKQGDHYTAGGYHWKYI